MESFLPSSLRKHVDPKEAEGEQQEQSLTSILTREERSEFTLLLNDILATQRRKITDVFDPRFAGLPSDAKFQVNAATGKDTTPTAQTTSPQPSQPTEDEDDLETQRKAAERRVKELSEPETQQLKRAVLTYFDEWRDSVLSRVGEVVNSREEAVAQKSEAQAVTVEAKDKKLDASGTENATSGEAAVEGVASESTSDDVANNVLETMTDLYPPITSSLSTLPLDKRKLIVHSTLLLLLSLEHYPSYSRILLVHLTTSLKLPVNFLVTTETSVAKTLVKAASVMSAEESRKKREDDAAVSKKWKIGLATVAGAALVGITGGLAAPLVAAGLGTVMGGLGLEATVAAAYLGTLASSSVVVGGLFGAYGGRMTGRMMEEYAKEVEDFGFVPVRQPAGHKRASLLPRKEGDKGAHEEKHKSGPAAEDAEAQRLRIAIGISGWLTAKDEILTPWRVLAPSITTYALRFELQTLLALGNALTAVLRSTAWGYAKAQIIKRTILAGLTEAMWPLAILKVGKIVDNPYQIAKLRAEKAGIVLADALIKRAQGERPVTLVGYSMGARVIYHCLLSLASRGAFGLVENAVLLGAPVPADSKNWRRLRAVVAGRLVNVYSENDYVLAFLHRTSSVQLGVAGIQAAEFVRGIENVDVSDIVDGHLRYRFLAGSILKRIGFEDLDLEAVEREEAELRAVEQLEQEERDRKEEKDPDVEAQELEKEVERKNEEGMLDWATSRLNLGYESAKSFFVGKSAAQQGTGSAPGGAKEALA